MSIFYRLYQNNSENFVNKGKWYARSVVMGKMVGLEELAEHMAEHNTPYSEGIIKGVLTDMINCIRELVLDGKAVKIPNLCIFSAGIQSQPADTCSNTSRGSICAHAPRASSRATRLQRRLTCASCRSTTWGNSQLRIKNDELKIKNDEKGNLEVYYSDAGGYPHGYRYDTGGDELPLIN